MTLNYSAGPDAEIITGIAPYRTAQFQFGSLHPKRSWLMVGQPFGTAERPWASYVPDLRNGHSFLTRSGVGDEVHSSLFKRLSPLPIQVLSSPCQALSQSHPRDPKSALEEFGSPPTFAFELCAARQPGHPCQGLPESGRLGTCLRALTNFSRRISRPGSPCALLSGIGETLTPRTPRRVN